MGFLGCVSITLQNQRPCGTCLSKNPLFFSFFLFQKCNKFVRVSSKAYIDTLSILTTRAREDANFVFIVTVANFLLIWNLSKSCTLGANHQIVIAKPKSEPIMTKSLGVAEDFSPERGQPLGDSMSGWSRPATGFTHGNWIIDSETWSGKPEPGIKC